MTYTERLLAQIGSSALEQASQEAEQITAQTSLRCDKEIESYRDKLRDRMRRDVQKQIEQIRRNSLGARARRQTEARHMLFNIRQELCDCVFGAVRARLLEYAGTEQYRSELLARLKSLKDAYDHSDSVVALRQEDARLADEISALLPGCAVIVGRGIMLGGFTLRNEKAGVLINETLDERLRSQMPWFLENCNLRVV